MANFTNITEGDMNLSDYAGKMEENLELGATVAFIAVVVLRVVFWFLAHKRLGASLILGWLAWLLVGIARGTTSTSEVLLRLEALQLATRTFLVAGIRMTLAWGTLLMPMLSDLGMLFLLIWGDLTVDQRMAVVFSGLGVFIVYKLAMKARENKEVLKEAAFQGSFLLVGPAIWKLLFFTSVQTVSSCLVILTTWVPTVMSIVTYMRVKKAGKGHHKASSRLWLSYWTCWPTVEVFTSAAVAYGQGIQELHVGLIILLVWLQFWGGSLHVPDLVMKFFYAVLLPMWSLAVTNLPSFVRNPFILVERYAGNVSKIVSLAKENKVVAAILALVVVVVLGRIFTTISSVLTLCIWWGAGMKTTDIVASHLEYEYQPNLGFWILGMLFELITMIPLVGSVVGMWEPIVLAIALVFPEKLVNLVILIPSYLTSQTSSKNIDSKVQGSVPSSLMKSE
eukprot:m.10305 g.10305  ORF g.10305 m.10305 type:complete len:451 (+) comp4238_c0_seq1:288-1640(+)